MDNLYSYRSWRQNSVERKPPIFSKSPKKKRPKILLFLKLVFSFILIATLLGGTFIIGFIAWVSKDLPDPNKIIEREVPLSTKIYDRTGEILLYEVHGAEKRTIVELNSIPKFLIDATITAEDRNFYLHKGYSITGIIRSIIKNFTTGSRVSGSTITQQLIKNAILTSEKTYARKIKELILAYQIEKKFSKDEILKMYFNEIPYGSTAYGVEAAAQTYFGKSAKDVSLAEATILAALTNRPSYLWNNQDKLIARQQWVLDSMVTLGYITQKEADDAKKTKIVYKKPGENIIAPHFVMYVKEYLSERYGEKAVDEGGLRVITTLDLKKQKFAEDAIKNQVEKNKKWNASNAALVSLDAKTGQILAMVGSADYFNDEIDGQVNVTMRPRQPGSSFKPVVYAAAFKKGYTPETVVFDAVTKFKNYDGKEYVPHNYNLKEYGPVTLREALAGSLNIPAVEVIYLTSIDNVIDLAQTLGYATLSERWRFGLSLVLGGAEVKLIEHANAFATFAREGEHHAFTPILKVEDKNGTVLEEFKNQETKVLETQIARQINSILSDNSARAFIFGENNHLTLKDRPVAAKTGTTNDNRDAWTIGYTPSIATGVWVGNNDFSEMKKGADGSVVAAPIWNAYMSKALENTSVESFEQPNPTVSDKPVLNGSLKEGVKISIDRESGKLATEFTPLDYIEEKTYRQLHSILFYINKDDPQGPAPLDPSTDPEFAAWEEAVQEWAKKNNIVSEEPPTEYDDIHIPENKPKITILSPLNNQKIEDRLLNIEVSVEARRGIKKVQFYLDGKLIGEKINSPYNFSAILDNNDIPNGVATLRVSAFDDVGNTEQAFTDINLALPVIEPAILWLKPQDGAIITKDDFPKQISFLVNRPQNIESINSFVEKPDMSKMYINTIRQIHEANMSIYWNAYPGPGIYKLYFVVNNKDGFIYQSEKITVEVK